MRDIENRTDFEQNFDNEKCDHGCVNADSFTVAENQYENFSDDFGKASKYYNYNSLREKDLFRRIDFAVLDRTAEQYNFKEFYRNFGN